MFVSDLYVFNYRSLEKIHIKFKKGRNILVGKNNSGKSNIIKAINLLLGESFPTYLKFEEKDFYTKKVYQEDSFVQEVANNFNVIVRIEGTDLNRELLGKCRGIYVSREGVDRWLESDNEINPYFISETDQINKYWKGKEELYDFITTSDELYFYLNVYRNKESTDSNEKYLKTYGMILKQNNSFYRSWGFNKDFRDSILTSAILPAFRDPSNQLKLSDWSWYGKLIKSIWDSKSEEVSTQIWQASDLIKELSNDVFKNAITDLKDKLSEAVYHHSVSFQLLPNTKDDIFKGVNLFVDDGIESLASDKGSGIQSALIIALFSYYCSEFHKNSSLLAIEEPELYLHPHARRVLSSKLDEFVNGDSEYSNQVIIATHSPEFIRNTEIENIFVVRKENSHSSTSVYNLNSFRDREVQRIKQVLWNRNAEMFFADKVILVEGGEEFLLPIVANKLFEKDNVLDYYNISIIRAGGKSQFNIYLKILKSLNIDYYVLADFDFLLNGLEAIKDFIPNYDADQLSEIRKLIFENSSSGFIKPSRIKEKILTPEKSLDAKVLCEILDRLCETETFHNELQEVWEYLRPKVINKPSYSSFGQEVRDELDIYLDKLWETSNIYILKYGELEDYRTDFAVQVITDMGVSGKELSVIKLVELINENIYKLEELFNVSEFGTLIVKAIDR